MKSGNGKSKENADGRVSGLVEKVTFHSEETGFSVLRVKSGGRRDQITIIAVLPSVTEGEWIDADGEWVIDPKHGQQFKASEARTSSPNTAEGIERYLGSGLIKGIGPHFASKLVAAFGAGVFEIIENSPRRLLEVNGIGPVRRDRILAAWREQKSVREIMVFLHSQGVGTSRAFRIYKIYGEKAVDLIREDPYRLARDVQGIGFRTADAIAQRLGVDRLSDMRARAGVEYALLELTDEGHCAYPRQDLIARTSELLEIPPELAERAVNEGIESNRLTARTSPSWGELVYIAGIEASERLLASNLLALLRTPHDRPGIDAAKAAAWAEEKLCMTLGDEQREALMKAVAAKVAVMTGGPGVGKTTLISAIVKIFRAKKMKVALCAPTGRASRRMSEAAGIDAATIHRLLKFDPRTGDFNHNQRRPLDADAVIVDESSMIDVMLAHQLVRAIPPRASLLLVGDADQLPSVGPGRVLKDAIDSGVIPVLRLATVHRQAARSEIISGAHSINAGITPEIRPGGGDASSDLYFFEENEAAAAADLVVSLVRERIPGRFGFHPVDEIQVLTPMQKGELGARNLNVVLQEALNPGTGGVKRFGFEYKHGDKVMQTVNNYDKDVFNGDIGRIAGIDEVEGEIAVRYDDRTVKYSFGELDEIQLSYAVTIHKSQGSEYPCVVIPIHTQHYMLLQRNLLYTAVTRGKRLVVLVGSRKALSMAVARMEAKSRITTLAERLQAGEGERELF